MSLADIRLLEVREDQVSVEVTLDKSLPAPPERPFNGSHTCEITTRQLHERDGRKVSLPNLVMPFLEDYFWDLRYHKLSQIKTLREILCEEFAELEAEEISEDVKEIADHHFSNEQKLQRRIKENCENFQIQNYQEWLRSQDDECGRLYGMSAEDFYKLTPAQQASVRKENNVNWINGKWDKNDDHSASS